MNRLKGRFKRNYIKNEQEETIPYYPQQEQVEEQYERQYQYAPLPPEIHPQDNTPLAIVKEVKKRPSPKGTLPTVISGVPVDLHILEDYLIKTSPFALKTIIRYHNARTIEEIKGYGKGPGMKMNSKTLILIMLCIGMAVLGILMLTILPDLLGMFSGGI